ncbi:MAG TPA: cupin domain-containing protein [Bryobacteraceae bacterium]|jgi:mannose-6-phosphate isomerase-like protein (cupin superfamily)
MFRILKRSDQRNGAIATVEFEGEPYGAGVSFFLGNLPPGKGPGLHEHPYSETCIVLSGQAAMVVDGQEVVASAGDIVVIGPATPHRFTAIGDERLDMVCVHASDRFVIESLRD